jgi:hypothetical protein
MGRRRKKFGLKKEIDTVEERIKGEGWADSVVQRRPVEGGRWEKRTRSRNKWSEPSFTGPGERPAMRHCLLVALLSFLVWLLI